MKTLTLIIKQKYFDQILSGEKKIETREIRPSSEKRHVVIDEEGMITDIIQYDALRLFVGYNKNRDSAIVQVTDSRLLEIVDENGEPIYFEYKGNQYQMIDIEYSLGAILEKNTK
jgi:hypothetical protein